jgi:hypothetical protein
MTETTANRDALVRASRITAQELATNLLASPRFHALVNVILGARGHNCTDAPIDVATRPSGQIESR